MTHSFFVLYNVVELIAVLLSFFLTEIYQCCDIAVEKACVGYHFLIILERKMGIFLGI